MKERAFNRNIALMKRGHAGKAIKLTVQKGRHQTPAATSIYYFKDGIERIITYIVLDVKWRAEKQSNCLPKMALSSSNPHKHVAVNCDQSLSRSIKASTVPKGK